MHKGTFDLWRREWIYIKKIKIKDRKQNGWDRDDHSTSE
jgi:hypothetical protein